MISNERPLPYGVQTYTTRAPKPIVVEDTLKTDKVQIERKTFVFTLKENPRGRFLRITKDVNGRRDAIIVPATQVGGFSHKTSVLGMEAKPNPLARAPGF